MNVGVITCRPETKLTDVAKMMVGYDIHSVVVSAPGDRVEILGIVSTLDLARVAERLGSLTAGEVASTDLVTISSDESLDHAAELMAEHRVTHLIALQPGTDEPVGVISAKVIAAALAYGRS
jgi:CBS domain-containing protein